MAGPDPTPVAKHKPALFKDQDGFVLVREKLLYHILLFKKHFSNTIRRAVAEAELNYLWRVTSEKAAVEKVRVFGDDCESPFNGKLPNLIITGMRQVLVANMARVRKISKKIRGQSVRQILIEKELHATATESFFSRSAANARQALMSSLVRSGKSWRISDSVIPDARYSRTSETVIRKPRIQGFPLRFPASMVIIRE